MKTRILFAMAAGFSVAVSAAQPENVPELMTTFGGEKVSTLEQWETIRAPELLKEFTNEEYGKIKEFIEGRAGLTVIAVANEDTPFPTIKLPKLTGYDPFLQLMAGWNLLVQIGIALGIDLDKPERARKVGNQFEG